MIRFLNLDEILSIQKMEIVTAGGAHGVRDIEAVKACVEAPKATFGGEYLMSIFGMATTYISSLSLRHPFIDGNKRVALASALTFLFLNGYEIDEEYPEELADLVLDFVTRKISKDDLELIIQNRVRKIR